MNRALTSFRHSSFRGLIGVAEADITPPPGIYSRNWGAAKRDCATGVHMPLKLTALTFQASARDKPLVLIGADVSGWRSILTEKLFRQRVLQSLDIDSSRLLFCLSHSHSAPALAEPDPMWEGGDLLREHLQKVQQAAIERASQALQTATFATLEWNSGRCSLAKNRDSRDPQTDRAVTGFNAEMEADDTLLVGRITGEAGKTLATIANYACHPTTLAWENTLISPDFVGAMRETVCLNTEGGPTLFLQGASGELAPRYQYVGDVAVADAHGRQLAFATLAVLAGMEPPGIDLKYDGVVESGAPLAIWKRESYDAPTNLRAIVSSVNLPLKDWPSAEELEGERAASTNRATEERLRRKRDIRRTLGDGETFAMPFWVWRIGDAFLVGCMVEAYSWIQRYLRSRFSDFTIVYVNLVNGSIGYLPPSELYGTDAYPVWQTPFERGSLEALAKACGAAIESLL